MPLLGVARSTANLSWESVNQAVTPSPITFSSSVIPSLVNLPSLKPLPLGEAHLQVESLNKHPCLLHCNQPTLQGGGLCVPDSSVLEVLLDEVHFEPLVHDPDGTKGELFFTICVPSGYSLIEIALRKIWHLPPRSHTAIVHCVAQVDTISNHLYKRFQSFLSRSLSSSSPLINTIFNESSYCIYSFTGYNAFFGHKHIIIKIFVLLVLSG